MTDQDAERGLLRAVQRELGMYEQLARAFTCTKDGKRFLFLFAAAYFPKGPGHYSYQFIPACDLSLVGDATNRMVAALKMAMEKL